MLASLDLTKLSSLEPSPPPLTWTTDNLKTQVRLTRESLIWPITLSPSDIDKIR